MFTALLLFSALLFVLAYRFYGRFLTKQLGLDDKEPTPAVTQRDGVDFVPTRASVLFGHHFSSIAGAGPIVGPILAAMYFGWGPTWLWIIIGAVFVGGVHDLGSALLSLRNKGQSITATTRKYVGEGTGRLFLAFVILALIYVIIVFLDLTASTFVTKPQVATASGWFVLVAGIFGALVLRGKIPFGLGVVLFIPITFAGLAVGEWFPLSGWSKQTWLAIIILYCAVAAVLPVNLLLQPRDFLSATFLYAMLLGGLMGALFLRAPLTGESMFLGWEHASGGALMPFLFITVACGACSGFHSMVSSGTTSKQLACETDARRVNYGGMLVEGFLAVLAIGTVVVLSREELSGLGNPVAIFSAGMARFMGAFGLPEALGATFASLAVSTFLLTTLDTCTRLCRFLFEEAVGVRNQVTRYLGTLAVLAIPAVLAFQTLDGQPLWRAIWPLFGATNQLMAALALITLVVFLRARRKAFLYALLPAILMIIMPIMALVLMAQTHGPLSLLGGAALGMLLLGVMVVGASLRFILRKAPPNSSPEATHPAR